MSSRPARPALRRTLLAAAIGTLGAFAAPAAGAQQPLDPVRTVPVDRANARADTLEALVATDISHRGRWGLAARRQRDAARLRGDDPRAVGSWARAAWLYAGIGDFGTARSAMERAAEKAVADGDVERAAHAYIDAALIAVEGGRDDLVDALVRKTFRVTGSPLLAADRRAAIRARVQQSAVIAQRMAALEER